MRIPSSVSMSVPFSYTVERPQEDLILYTFTGDVDSPQLEQLTARWEMVGTPRAAEIVVDLSAVTFLGVDGMWLLDRFRRRAQRKGSRFSLITDVPRIDGPLRALGFAERFDYRSHWEFTSQHDLNRTDESNADGAPARAPETQLLTEA